MRRVLVVDDSRAVRRLLVQILEAHRYAPVEAETGEDALRIALQDPPDAMVVDHHLPGCSGADLVREVRSATCEKLRTAPIVGLSGLRGSEKPLLDAGASCFIAKPFREADLLKALRWAFDVYT